MKKALIAACCCAGALAALAADASARSWAQPQIALVTKRGIFNGTPATFRAEQPLTRQALAHVVGRLTGDGEKKLRDGARPVTLAELDAALVRALGLGDAAYLFARAARRSGLAPPPRFGTEVVARLLGLRLNHPVGQEDLDLRPQQVVTRAEAAYSVARILGFRSSHGWEDGYGRQGSDSHPWRRHGWDGDGVRRHTSAADATRNRYAESFEVERVERAARTFELPALTPWQRRILRTAVSYIGFPYTWGGTGAGTPGFDCSGFVWRVYKLTAYRGGEALAGTLRGRTTMQMSGEVGPARRIRLARLRPGDVLFFGSGPRSSPAAVDHAGIYLGNGWFIQSSRYGVALAELDGWYRSSFAWGRRPLAEAGLA